MKRIVRLTESELNRYIEKRVKRYLNENCHESRDIDYGEEITMKNGTCKQVVYYNGQPVGFVTCGNDCGCYYLPNIHPDGDKKEWDKMCCYTDMERERILNYIRRNAEDLSLVYKLGRNMVEKYK